MASKADRDHFDSYRAQTRTKHTILEKYLPAYFDIVRKAHKRLMYIDAFAGAGYYKGDDGERHAGSPIRALQLLIDKPRFQDIVRCLFAEPNAANFPSLEQAVAELCNANPQLAKPTVLQMEFTDLISELKEMFDPQLKRMAPGFLLVDPCGLAGAAMQGLATVLQQPYSEVFVFFNAAGLARVLGAKLIGQVAELYGDEDVAHALIDEVANLRDSAEREAHALAKYEQQLRDLGLATHVCSFRIEYEDRATTSHYLIHASKHPVAFKIMKDIMWSEGSGRSLELRQATADPEDQLTLELGDADVDADILIQLDDGPKPVSYFTEQLCIDPGNRIAAKYYKERLIALEALGRLTVWRNGNPAPADARRPRLGKPTLADTCEVRLVG